MYKFNKDVQLMEQIQMGDEIITVSLNIDEVASRFITAMSSVENAQKLLSQAHTNKSMDMATYFDTYNSSVEALMLVVFGEENTTKIKAFYDNKYLEMTTEVFPFVANVVMPKIKASADKKVAAIKNSYKR